jgi:hypothetical protein
MNEFVPSDFRPDSKKEPEGFKNFEDPFDISDKTVPNSKRKIVNLAWLWWVIVITIIVIIFIFNMIGQMHI